MFSPTEGIAFDYGVVFESMGVCYVNECVQGSPSSDILNLTLEISLAWQVESG